MDPTSLTARAMRAVRPWQWAAAAVTVTTVAGAGFAFASGPTASSQGAPVANVAAPSTTTATATARTIARDAAAEPSTVAAASLRGVGVRAMVAEYPLDYSPRTASTLAASGMVNPKSRPLLLGTTGSAPQRSAAFPSAGAALLPQAATGPLPGGSLPAGQLVSGLSSGAPVTNAAVYALIQASFPASQWDNANRVSLCESGQRNVVSAPNNDGTRDYGIFQLNSSTLPGLLSADGLPPTALDTALDAQWNVRAAARLWQERGWEPWTCAAKLQIVAGLWSNQPGPGAR